MNSNNRDYFKNFADMLYIFHDTLIIKLQEQQPFVSDDEFLNIVFNNHECNFKLWNSEDCARRDDMGYEFVYKAKRAIDTYNQHRNNFIEAMDAWLLQVLIPHADCSVNSETPGMIIDRLSILSLKIYHMQLQTERLGAGDEHVNSCKNKLLILQVQKQQLSQCLQNLLLEIIEHQRTFKVYYQLKMYNDPNLNPQLYNNTAI